MKVLFIAEIASPHAARWIDLTVGAEVESAIFQATCGPTEMCEDLRSYLGTVFTPKPVPGVRNPNVLYENAEVCDALVLREGIYPDAYADFLKKAIREFKPDLIHVLGLCVNFRNSTRCLLRAAKTADFGFPPIVYSSWGADLDYYAKVEPSEAPFISEFLKIAGFHITECQRDVRLARDLGFTGRVLATVPANGGMDDSVARMARDAGEVSRNLILIKGRDESDGDPIGRAMQILDAIELSSASLRNFRIEILQASRATNIPKRAHEIAARYGLNIEILPYVSTAELYEKLSRSYIFMANTINDGLPLSLVEAMTFGAYPIHSDLESIRDYVSNDQNGSLVAWNDVDGLATAIAKTISSPDFVAKARIHNYKLTQRLFVQSVVSSKMTKAYAEAAGFQPEMRRKLRVTEKFLNARKESAKDFTWAIVRTVDRVLPKAVRNGLRRALDSYKRLS